MAENLKTIEEEPKSINATSQAISETQIIGEFDLDVSPPDFELAKQHGLSKRVYKPPLNGVEPDLNKFGCLCCKLPPPGETFKLSESLSPLNSHKYLRSGYILYFNFLKYSIFILLLIFSVSGLYNMISNLVASDCENDVDAVAFCVEDYITIFSLANKKEHGELNFYQAILNIITVLFIMAFFHYIRYQNRKVIAVEDLELTPSDFTLRIDCLTSADSDESIRKRIEALGENLEIKHISRTYKIAQYIRKYKKFELVKQKWKKHKSDTVLKAKYEKLEKKVQKLESEDLKPGSSAFVMFNTPERKLFRLKNNEIEADIARFKLNKISLKERIKMIVIQGKTKIATRAPEPNEVLWENIGYPAKKKNVMKYVSFFLTILCIGAGFGIIIGLNVLQHKVSSDYGKKSVLTQVLSAVISVAIIIINILLEEFFVRLSKFEKASTYLSYFEQFITRLTIVYFIFVLICEAQFINTALVNIFVKISLSASYSVDFYGTSGLIPNIYYMFVITSFVTPILDLFNPGYFAKLAQQKYEAKKGDHSRLNQRQANQLFEGPDFGIVRRYVAVLKLTFLTCFYCQAIPLANFYIVIGLTLKYFIEKYIFTTRCVLPSAMGYRLNEGITELSEWNVFLFAMGNLVFSYVVKKNDGTKAYGDYEYLLWITLLISVVNIFLPMEEINKFLFKINSSSVSLTFDQAKVKFKTSYEIENPVTRVFELEKIKVAKAGGDINSIDTSRLDLKYKSLQLYALHEAKSEFKIVEENEPPKECTDLNRLIDKLSKRKETQALTGVFGATFTKIQSTHSADENASPLLFHHRVETKPEVVVDAETSAGKAIETNDINAKIAEISLEVANPLSKSEIVSPVISPAKKLGKQRPKTKSSFGNIPKINVYYEDVPQDQEIFSAENMVASVRSIQKEEIGNKDYWLHVNPFILYKMWENWEDEDKLHEPSYDVPHSADQSEL